MFGIHESMKQRMSHSQWKCNECDKLFVSEYYADMHIDAKHSDVIPVYNKTKNYPAHTHAHDTFMNANNYSYVCLADYCEILRCTEDHDEFDHAPREGLQCRPAKMQSLRFECYNIMTECFPNVSDIETVKIKEYFKGHLCDTLKCEIREDLKTGDTDDLSDGCVVHATMNPSAKSKYLYKVSVSMAFIVIALFVMVVMCIIQSISKEEKLWDSRERKYRKKIRSSDGYARTHYGKKSKHRGHTVRTKIKKLVSSSVKVD